MAIISLDNWIAASKQRAVITKIIARTTVSLLMFSLFDIDGQPGKGTIAGTSTANGVVPTDATAGCPLIDFSSGVGYLGRVEYSCTVACRLFLYDMLFKAGAYSFAAGTTSLSSQPAISSRCPDYTGGAAFGNGNQIWLEVVTAFVTGNNWQVQVTYTNSAGTTGRTSIISAAQTAANMTLGRMFQIALQAGDSGVQKIESVIVTNGATAMTVGTFNILILRPLWSNRILVANAAGIDGPLQTGMPIVYLDSALITTVQADSTSSGIYTVLPDIVSG